MKFEYRLQLKDLIEAHWVYSKEAFFRYCIGLIILIVTTDLISFFTKFHFLWNGILLRGTIPNFILLTSLYALVYAQQYYAIKHDFEKQPIFRDSVSVEMSEEGLEVKTSTSESKIKWSSFSYWKETPNLFLLYYPSKLHDLFPKRAFESDRQIDEFQEILASRLPKK